MHSSDCCVHLCSAPLAHSSPRESCSVQGPGREVSGWRAWLPVAPPLLPGREQALVPLLPVRPLPLVKGCNYGDYSPGGVLGPPPGVLTRPRPACPSPPPPPVPDPLPGGLPRREAPLSDLRRAAALPAGDGGATGRWAAGRPGRRKCSACVWREKAPRSALQRALAAAGGRAGGRAAGGCRDCATV